jgi:hypothetical protein
MGRDRKIELFQCLADGGGAGGRAEGGAVAEEEGLEFSDKLGEGIGHKKYLLTRRALRFTKEKESTTKRKLRRA